MRYSNVTPAEAWATDLARYPHGNRHHLGNPGNCEACHADHFGTDRLSLTNA